MSEEELLVEDQLMSSNRFAKVVGISPQSVINFVEQGRLIPHSKVEIGSNNGKPKYHYYFTRSQVADARFIAKKGKTNNNVLALCFADSQEELDKMADDIRKTLKEEKGLEEIRSLGEFYNKTLEEHEHYWKDSQELKDYIDKEVAKRLEEEILQINSEFDFNVTKSNTTRRKSIDSSLKMFMEKVTEMVKESEEAFADKSIEEITEELFGVDFIEVLINTFTTKEYTDFYNIIILIGEKVCNDTFHKIKILMDNVFKDINNFISINESGLKEVEKRKSNRLSILTKRLMSEEKAKEEGLEFGKSIEYYNNSLKKRYAIGDIYSKVREQCTLSYIDKKQKEIANARDQNNEKVSTLFAIEKVLVSDNEALQQAFIKMLSREFGQVVVKVNDCLDDNTILLLECLSRTKCIDITIKR